MKVPVPRAGRSGHEEPRPHLLLLSRCWGCVALASGEATRGHRGPGHPVPVASPAEPGGLVALPRPGSVPAAGLSVSGRWVLEPKNAGSVFRLTPTVCPGPAGPVVLMSVVDADDVVCGVNMSATPAGNPGAVPPARAPS